MSKVFEALQQLELDTGGLSASFSEEAQAVLRRPVRVPESKGTEVEEAPVLSVAVPAEPAFTPRVLPVRVTEDSPLMPFEPSFENVGEQYRIIRTKLVQHPLSPRVIAISSVDPGEGKTTTAINMAAALALKSETKVILVDCDLRRGQIGPLMGFPNSPGLTDVLAGTNSLEEAVVQVQELPNLSVLAAGTSLANPAEVLDSAQWRHLIDRLRRLSDYVILDTPPIGLIADTDLIHQVTDGVILVVRPDYTTRSRCLSVLKNNVSSRGLLGVVMNGVAKRDMGRSGEYYGYSKSISA